MELPWFEMILVDDNKKYLVAGNLTVIQIN